MIRTISIILCVVFNYHAVANLNNLDRGIRHGDPQWKETTKFLVERNYYPFSVFNTADKKLISFRSGISIYDLKNEVKVLGKSFKRWSHLKRPQPIMSTLLQFSQETPWREKVEYTSHKPFSGCLNQSPLRYGDIEEDGENEIVLSLNGELIVFSPKYERIVFAAFIQADDWFNDPNWNEPIGPSDSGKSYQYYSEQMLYNGHSEQGHRHYSKLYEGDFDSDGNPDIIRWSKTYASYEEGEQEGFYLVDNDLKHYERDLSAQKGLKQGVTGEYLPQITMDVIIEGWMRDNNLTWQKGFPSKSECEGQEGELIPEIHDPLLNDPDV